jgi:hypothetical protein
MAACRGGGRYLRIKVHDMTIYWIRLSVNQLIDGGFSVDKKKKEKNVESLKSLRRNYVDFVFDFEILKLLMLLAIPCYHRNPILFSPCIYYQKKKWTDSYSKLCKLSMKKCILPCTCDELVRADVEEANSTTIAAKFGCNLARRHCLDVVVKCESLLESMFIYCKGEP